MKTVSTSPDLAQLVHDLIVAHPMEAIPVMALALGAALWAWQCVFDY